jgi:diguanylate cyclase (GGDEF)-like protein
MHDQPLILVADDDDFFRFLTTEALEPQGFTVREACDGAAALAEALRCKPDLVMLDVRMPRLDGFDVCAQLRANPALMHVPVLMVTGLDDVESIEKAYRLGATSFIAKPIQWNTLAHHVRYVLRNSSIEAELRAAKLAGLENEAHARHMALHDALTGLPNRVLLKEWLNHAIVQAGREGEKVAALMLDLDHFKLINDSLGHQVGDRLLEAAAIRLRNSLRESDIVARLGGDEFVVGLFQVNGDGDAGIMAAEILRVLSEPFHVEGHELHVGCSIGISLYPGDGEDAAAMLRTADMAMYEAKEKRGTYRFFTPALDEAAQRRLTLTNDLRRAYERDEFILHYQPVVSMKSGMASGLEALLRWNHPEHGMISPTNFIPILEETGHIVEVGQWVLRTACSQSVKWQAEGLPPVRVAVNLSLAQFSRRDVAGLVDQALRQSGLRPELLELELTESMTLGDTTIQIMHELKELGVTLSLDNFGMGWSSLSYLRQFPLDKIKINRSFVRDIDQVSSAAAVVRGILSLAADLGLDCIAEGVETIGQHQFLQEQKCAEAQGFLYTPAVPAADVGALLRCASLFPEAASEACAPALNFIPLA